MSTSHGEETGQHKINYGIQVGYNVADLQGTFKSPWKQRKSKIVSATIPRNIQGRFTKKPEESES